MEVISIKDVLDARDRISGHIHRTPVVSSRALSAITGFDVFFKAENLQKTGSFKIRGACNRIFSLSREEGERGIVTASSGNHGQAVAYAAKLCGYKATVVMPEGGSPVKAASIKDYGAELIYRGTKSDERIALAKQMQGERGMTFVPPYDDPFVMAGQGTAGLEIIEDMEDVAAVLAPTGGCGLISGIATAVKETNPGISVFGVEPEGSNSTGISFRAGGRTALDHPLTVADGIRTTIPGELTFPVVQKYVDDMLTVTDAEVIRAQLLILERCKLLAEPTGAVAFAALLCGALPGRFKGRRVVSLISGGNVALPQLADYINKNCL
ncbi:MAG: threonine/serine dehydratase [Synergistaceae bacterium]|nr:threonine/serine dehydratase [Synergistaceae bacterium]